MGENLEQKYAVLTSWFAQYQQVFVAFSGGVDSTLILKASVDSLGPESVSAIIAVSPSLAEAEMHESEALAESMGVELFKVYTNELNNPKYSANDGMRCYFCKQELFAAMQKVVQAAESLTQREDSAVLVDGTNFDDLNDIRPGMKAAEEARIKHPFVELGIGKKEVRQLSRYLELPTWDKPEMACLASRIPIGNPVTSKKLKMVEDAETRIKDLGFREVRVRYHCLNQKSFSSSQNAEEAQLSLARIELGDEELPKLLTECLQKEVSQAVRKAGFSFVTIDLEGYRKGGVSRKNQ